MIKRPFIFLSENYAKFIIDGIVGNTAINLADIIIPAFPFEQTFFFTDQWGNVVNRDVDTLVLQRTNLVNATILAADNSGNYTPLFKITDNQEDTVFIKLAKPVKTSSLRIFVEADGNPNTVEIGKIGFYRYLCDLFAQTEATFRKDTNQGSFRVLSGAVVYYGDYDKWEAKIKIENLPRVQFDLLLSEIKSTNRLTVLPFQDFSIGEIYECYATPEISYEIDRKTELYSLSLEVQEL